MENFKQLKEEKLKRQLARYLTNEVKDIHMEKWQIKVLNDYDTYSMTQNLKTPTRLMRIQETVKLFEAINTPPKKITKEQINNYLKHIDENGYKEGTKNTKRVQIINLFEWVYDKKKQDIPLIKDIKVGKLGLVDTEQKASKLLSLKEIKKMVSVCDNARDKLIIIMLYESAARISEFLALKREDVELTNEKYVFVTLPKIKTKARRIPLIYSVPYLTDYLNSTAADSNDNTPLFQTNNIYQGKRRAFDEHGVRGVLRKIVSRANINKPYNAHWFRHSRLTELGGELKEAELRIYAGWVDGSPMAKVYVHKTDKDVADKLLANAGLIPAEDGKAKQEIFKVIQCPRCKKENQPDVKYCDCGFVLDIKTAGEEIEKVLETEKDKDKKFEDFKQEVLDMLKGQAKEKIKAEIGIK